jgi:hypothetical protein
MDIIAAIVAGVAGIALGIWGGLKLGERLQEQRPWKYWALNGVTVVVSVFALLLAGFTQQVWAWALVLAIFAGMLTGLKYGYGKSVGLWRVHDRIMRSDEHLRD